MFFPSAYISAARRVSPCVPRELEEYVASAYSSIRQEEAKSNTPHSYTTVRTLLSILRISAVSTGSIHFISTIIKIELDWQDIRPRQKQTASLCLDLSILCFKLAFF